jgi:hypothetical protein
MTIEQVFQDKTIKAKGKVSTIGEWLVNNEMPIEELLVFAEKQATKELVSRQWNMLQQKIQL